MAKLILYACPTGPLAMQIAAYYAESLQACGPNAAHAYMPHISLTGFFQDEPTAIPDYVALLEALLRTQDPIAVLVERLIFSEEFHGFEISSPGLRTLTDSFIANAPRKSRHEAIRPKTWLHLSLAYQFLPEHHATLKETAESFPFERHTVSCPWEVRFYERQDDNLWVCHSFWKI